MNEGTFSSFSDLNVVSIRTWIRFGLSMGVVFSVFYVLISISICNLNYVNIKIDCVLYSKLSSKSTTYVLLRVKHL